MRFIAPSDFSQGLRNPLKLPGGGMQVPKGTIFSIGGDDIPYDRAGRGLSGQDLETFHALYHLLVPLDSYQGRQIQAECERLKKMEHEMKRAESTRSAPHNYWYEKPVGLIVIGVIVAVAGFVLCEYLAHKFPGFFHSQKP